MKNNCSCNFLLKNRNDHLPLDFGILGQWKLDQDLVWCVNNLFYGFLFSAHLHEIDSFVSDGMEVLSSRPQSIEEIGEANKKHGELKIKKPEVLFCNLVSIIHSVLKDPI